LQRTFDRNIGIQGNLIFGDSAETLETANETMSWWAHNRRYQVYLSRLQVYPGSPDYIMAIRDGMIKDRARYADELPIYFNISKLNNDNLDGLSFQADIHGRTLLNVAPVLEFKRSTRQVRDRGIAYDIRWCCPRCGHVNQYEQGVLRPDHGKSLRVFCRSCRSRWDIKNYAAYAAVQDRSPSLDGPPPAEFQLSSDLQSADSKIITTRLNLTETRSEPYRFVKAANSVEELRLAGLAVAEDPFDPNRHTRFAESLAAVKALGAARLHFEQAVALAPQSPEYREKLDALLAREDYADLGETYFVSFSDDPPPFRPSRDKVTYNRKREPQFPVYSRAANRESVLGGQGKRLPIFFQK
jgi:transcription elongation factor Elf1